MCCKYRDGDVNDSTFQKIRGNNTKTQCELGRYNMKIKGVRHKPSSFKRWMCRITLLCVFCCILPLGIAAVVLTIL